MTVSVQKAETKTPVPPAAPPPDAEQESFVINLCSSTTPMALTQPQLAELKQFNFFVSRRLEDGRERFRLHMGYFDSLLQAEDMLAVVRDLYPGAWAGEAPGKRLRARAAAAKATPVAASAASKPAALAAPVSAPTPNPAPPPAPTPAPAPARTPARAAAPIVLPTAAQDRAAPVLAAAPSAELLARMPTLSAAPESAAEPAGVPFVLELMPDLPRSAAPDPIAESIASAPAPLAEVQAKVAVAAPAAVALAEPMPVPTPTAIAEEAPVAKAAACAGAPRRDASMPFDQRSNVREVLKSLDESARHPNAASPSSPPPAPAASPAATAPIVASAPSAPRAPVAVKPVVPEGPVVRQPGVLPESQVMHLLEEKRGGDPLNTTSTPAAFSVQLQWSVQPIDLARVPPLAIFGAYTLYTVEGSREGRRWYGLRLGFFSDANSAKQVAQYVRSEFSSVAVVPVSLKERDGASGASGTAPAAQKTTERLPDQSGEFKLLDDTGAMPKLNVAASAQTPNRAAVASAAAKVQAAKSKAAAAAKLPAGRTAQKGTKSRGNRVHAHDKRGPKTLEETLEILGADELQIEGARRQLISEGMIKHADVKVQKNSPFTRLLDRLAERNR